MGCSSCGSGGSPKGCQNNGACSSGGCNKLNTFDWLTTMELNDPRPFGYVEVSFKRGNTKRFYKNPIPQKVGTGDMVVVDDEGGYNVGQITLSGELVRLQMKKKSVKEDVVLYNVSRKANESELSKLDTFRDKEKEALIKSRAIARTLDLDMKIGDVEYRADGKKATFYYIAEGRVDFRELIRHYAKEFRIKVEMRQIGARQESALIGGLGSCGRELCCSTWLSDFKTVTTTAARYQNLAINQAKLSGQCGRLKCCLNYELDTYMDAVQDFPKRADTLKTQSGVATLIKTDIFKALFYYLTESKNGRRGAVVTLGVDRVKEILALNKKGERPLELVDNSKLFESDASDAEIDFDFEDVNNVLELPPDKRRRKKRQNRNRKANFKRKPRNQKGGSTSGKNPENKKSDPQGAKKQKPKRKSRRRPNNNKNKKE